MQKPDCVTVGVRDWLHAQDSIGVAFGDAGSVLVEVVGACGTTLDDVVVLIRSLN